MKRDSKNLEASQVKAAGVKKAYQKPAFEKSYLERFVTPQPRQDFQLGRGCTVCDNLAPLLLRK